LINTDLKTPIYMSSTDKSIHQISEHEVVLSDF